MTIEQLKQKINELVKEFEKENNDMKVLEIGISIGVLKNNEN